MKVALTGATGFIVSHVLTERTDHGHEVTALVRLRRPMPSGSCRVGAVRFVSTCPTRPRSRACSRRGRAIHTASPGDAHQAPTWIRVVDGGDRGVFDGTGSPTCRARRWSTARTPRTPTTPLPRTRAVRKSRSRTALGAAAARSCSSPALAYGDGCGGIPGLLRGSRGTRPAPISSAQGAALGRRNAADLADASVALLNYAAAAT